MNLIVKMAIGTLEESARHHWFRATSRERQIPISGNVLWQTENPFGNDVVLNLVCSTGDRLSGHRDKDLGNGSLEWRIASSEHP